MASSCDNEISADHTNFQDIFEALESGAFVDGKLLDKFANQCKGDHECEITFEGGDDKNDKDRLKTLYQKCDKNPGHPNFIPVTEFRIEHLPKPFRKERIMRSIQYWIGMTVKVLVKYVSKNRPDCFPDSEKPYPYSKIKGSNKIRRFGTGNIFGVAVEEDAVQEEVCPCHLCEKLEFENRQKEFWTILVETSKHVIFDSSEAKCCIVECFYDSDSTRSETVKTLYGYAMNDKESKINEDLCQVLCVTHDKELVEKLKGMIKRNDYVLVPQYKSSLGVLIAHPHGCSKRITIGRVCHLTVPVGWDYPAEVPIPCDDTMTCVLPLYPWSEMPAGNDMTNTTLESSSSGLPQNIDTPSTDSTQIIPATPDTISHLSQSDPSIEKNDTSEPNATSSSDFVEIDQADFSPTPGSEFLLPLGTTFTLPENTDYAFRFHRLNSTYFNFPPGTKFTLGDGRDVFFPPEAEFSMYMLSARVSYVSYTVDSCQGSSGAGLLLDGGNGVICCTFPHSGRDQINQGANRSGLQCYTILPKSVSAGKESASCSESKLQPQPVIIPEYVRFQFLNEG